jgi:uncharacterized protein with ParB-like and HNH nuclease domain
MEAKKTSVFEILRQIEAREYTLPAIQRKYVWEESQITKLMDSILLSYPIGQFLFWKIEKKAVHKNNYSFYEFIKDFNEKDKYINPVATIKGSGNVTAVLDGQQRLTSLYIALYGTLALHLKGTHKSKEESYPKKEMYMNLKYKKPSVDDEITYQFKFLTKEEAKEENDSTLWFKTKDILKYPSLTNLNTGLISKKGWTTNDIIQNNITRLHENIMVNENIISYCEVTENSMDKVLDIFIRINSGGTILAKSDLLFSTIISHWVEARDIIDELLKHINDIGDGFKFDLDFIMRTSLYLLDFSINLKSEIFKQENVIRIKDAWDDINLAIRETVRLLSDFGFCSKNITSYVAIIPIIYHRYKVGKFDKNTKKEIRKYFVIVQVKQIFGASTNTTLEKIRKEVGLEKNFTVAQFADIEFTGNTKMRFTHEEVKELFDNAKGAYTFMLLSLLYPEVNYNNLFHQDHLHPYAAFSDINLKGLGLDKNTRKDWQEKRNKLANLQLLEGKENQSKNDSDLKTWLSKDNNKQKTKYLPKMSYELEYFETFLIERQKLMEAELVRILL